MVYITVKQEQHQRQMSLEELFYQEFNPHRFSSRNTSDTRTDIRNAPSAELMRYVDIIGLIHKLTDFNEQTKELRECDRQELYNTWFIPKKSGGRRRIDAPKLELITALRNLKSILEDDFGALYHTAAFAYIKHRCTLDAVKRHQQNKSKWFLKLDLHDFFGSTTQEYVMKMFSMIFPFSEVVKIEAGKKQLETALSLAFLNGGLPQGTPISPTITNIMMIPVDHRLATTLRNFEVVRGANEHFKEHLVYTRYADDFLISNEYSFDWKKVQQYVLDVLKEFGAPFSVNTKKTRYGSSSGRNWNLGVMLNADNEITVGYKRKKEFQRMAYQYVTESKSGNKWPLDEVQHLQGLYSYYHMVEPETFDRIIKFMNEKYNADILAMIKADIFGNGTVATETVRRTTPTSYNVVEIEYDESIPF